MDASQWIIRNAVGTDLPFIYSTWSNSVRYGSSLGKSCRSSIFYLHFNKVIDHLLAQDQTTTLVACLPDQTDVILGYLVYQPNIIHYSFVKEAFRRLGVCRSLFDKTGLRVASSITHRTYLVDPILEKYPSLLYNPFLLFKIDEPSDQDLTKAIAHAVHLENQQGEVNG